MKKTTRARSLGELQLRILQLLWEHGEMTASRMHAVLHPERGLAPTTVATMLAKMEGRGLLVHREEGRAFVYRAAVESEKITQEMGDQFVDRLFGGSVAGAVMNLLRTREVSHKELNELEKLIRHAKQGAK